MKLHLPVLLRKSVLSCLVAVVACTMGSGAAWADAQNLTYGDSSLIWDTQRESFVNEAGNAAAFATGDNVSFSGESRVSLGENITAGTVVIEKDADVTIDLGEFELDADRIELGGTLAAGDSLSIDKGSTLEIIGAGAVLDSNLVLGEKGVLLVTGAGGSLGGHSLTLQQGASLILTGAVMERETTDADQDGELSLIVTPTGDGKTYTLLTGVSALVDKEGNALTAGSYSTDDLFDSSQPGAGFWAGGTLVYAADGTLTLVRHNEIVKDALDVTTPQTGSVDYSYYKGISFKDLSSSLSSFVARGGAIYGRNDSTIMLSNNGSVEFRGNTASSSGSSSGGAIYGAWRCTITLSNNGSVEFRGNTASSSGSSSGGAIWGYTITLRNNGSVEFRGNTASSSDYYARGGAIYGDSGSTITLSDNGSVTFSGNTASASSDDASGGAIRAYGDLSIRNNDSVSFYQNAEVKNGSYRLRSIYAEGSGDVISLSAAAGKSITFYDSVYIGSGAMVNLNQDYTYQEEDGISFSIKQQGDIIFTGKYAETHLNEILAADEQGRTATTEEILLSRTTEVNALTNLHGGRLRVEDGAIYRGQGITVHEGSNATVRVKDATLNHTGYELHFFEGTTLATLGESEIFGDVIVESTATAAFSALTRLEGNLTLASGSELSLDGALTLNGTLTLGLGLTLSGDILADIKNLAAGQSITLVSGLESLTVQMQTLMRSLEYTTVMTGQELVAADYFSNLQTDSGYVLIYNGATGALMVTQSIPEPTTATLSLLALAALAARRRRK